MAKNSEKERKPRGKKKWLRKDGPMTMRAQLNPVEGLDETSRPTRAVFINTRTCLQSLTNPCTKYLNIPVRLVERYVPCCHWGILCSTENPPQTLKSGQQYTLVQPWKSTSSTFELEVLSSGDERRPRVHMGSCEQRFPAGPRRSKHIIYLGTTTLSDAQLLEVGELVLRYLKTEKGYHGIYRNCQHFAIFFASVVCPYAKLPKTADSLLWGMLHLFKRKNTDLKKRIKHVTEFYEKERRQAVIMEKDIQDEIGVIDPQHQ